jgi:hypothetical protein
MQQHGFGRIYAGKAVIVSGAGHASISRAP